MQINSKPTHMQSIIIVLQMNTYFSHHLSKLLITMIKNLSLTKRCTIIGSNILVKIFLQRFLEVPCSQAAPWVVAALGLSMDVWHSVPVPDPAAPLWAGGTALRAEPWRRRAVPAGVPPWAWGMLREMQALSAVLSDPFKLEYYGLFGFAHLSGEISSAVIA